MHEIEGHNKELHSAIMASRPLRPLHRSSRDHEALGKFKWHKPLTTSQFFTARMRSAVVAPALSAPLPLKQAEDDGSALQAYLRKAHLAKARACPPPRQQASPATVLSVLPLRRPRLRNLSPASSSPQIEAEAEEHRMIDRLNADPFDIEAQKKIEELIAQKNVQESYMNALEARPSAPGGGPSAHGRSDLSELTLRERLRLPKAWSLALLPVFLLLQNNPEMVVGTVTMLYVNMVVNGVPLQVNNTQKSVAM